MARKPDIQYVHNFYVHGSEAKVLELKPRKKLIKTVLPKILPDKSIRIPVDPLAMVSCVVAAVLLVMMVVGCFQFAQASSDYRRMSGKVIALQNENVRLHQQFQDSYDIDEIAHMANSLGMVPASEAQTVYIEAQIPVREAEPTVWENIAWFLDGLFA